MAMLKSVKIFPVRITWLNLQKVVYLFMATLIGLVLPFTPMKIRFALLALIPASVGAYSIISNPYWGICYFYSYEFLRPDNFVPAIRPLRLALMIEALTLLSWLLYMGKSKTKLKWNGFNWAYLGFLVVVGSTVITATNNFFAYNVFQTLLVNFVMFVIAVNCINSVKSVSTLVWVLLLIHFYFGIRAIVTGGFVGGSLMEDENDLALALNLMIPFAFFFLLYYKDIRYKLTCLVILLTLVMGVVASLSRGGWVGLMAIIIYCVLKSKKILVSLIIVLLLSVFAILFAPATYWDEVNSISDTQESTAQARFRYWETALRMFVDYPLTGVGAGNGGVRFPEYYLGILDPNTQWGRAFHGTIPQVGAELGSLGLLFYSIMLILAIRYLYKIQNRQNNGEDSLRHVLARSLLGSIIGFQVTGAFLSTAYYPQLWLLYALTLSLYLCEDNEKNHSLITGSKND